MYFQQFVNEFPSNVILVTTLETNRDTGYGDIAKAPTPTKRHQDFLNLGYPRKVLTLEPLVDFDTKRFAEMILAVQPEYVWMGYNSQPKSCTFPEPPLSKVRDLQRMLKRAGVEIREKDMRQSTQVGSK